ncbi:CoA transferase [Myxococcota bacterium]|nr:CoA transferase [Myxococcota bacterium]
MSSPTISRLDPAMTTRVPSVHAHARALGAPGVWRGPLDVDGFAVACVETALDAAAGLAAARGGLDTTVALDPTHAAACFATESLVEPIGWRLPPAWDPIAGDYAAADGFIRLHTNYVHHRRAALSALGVPDTADLTRDALAPVVARFTAEALETAVVDAGGAAAAQRDAGTFWASDAGRAVANEPPLAVEVPNGLGRRPPLPALPPGGRPFDGVRVLDLTRVLAGPTCTGFLAAWGAEVLRLDPPGFEEVPALVPLTTAGKRTACLDLRGPEGRQRFEALLHAADVVVHGYRSGALDALGLPPSGWHAHRPGLVEVSLTAYGFTGPWMARRAFDSLVQHSVGITALSQAAAGSPRPVPLPCQALDHGAGWLMAAAVAAGLTHRQTAGVGSRWRTSLARMARLLLDRPRVDALDRGPPTLAGLAAHAETAETAWGPLKRLRWPGHIGGVAPRTGPVRGLGADPMAAFGD